jgi:hypothetical protein
MYFAPRKSLQPFQPWPKYVVKGFSGNRGQVEVPAMVRRFVFVEVDFI